VLGVHAVAVREEHRIDGRGRAASSVSKATRVVASMGHWSCGSGRNMAMKAAL
jgi:hypothetical protein